MLVAEAEGTVAGMTELVIRSEPPPDHQILVPRPLAEVHTVVLERFRGRGIGTALVKDRLASAATCRRSLGDRGELGHQPPREPRET